MHIQDLQVDLNLHPDDWKGFEVMEEIILYHDREKGSSTKQLVVKRLEDKKYFNIEYTQWSDDREFENEVKEVFPKQIIQTFYV